jgi:hypothetical protein
MCLRCGHGVPAPPAGQTTTVRDATGSRSDTEGAAQGWPGGAATRRRRLEAHPSPVVLQLQVLDVQRQDLAGSRRAVSYNIRHGAHARRHNHAARQENRCSSAGTLVSAHKEYGLSVVTDFMARWQG